MTAQAPEPKRRKRSRKSAKEAGTRFATQVAGYLATVLPSGNYIERRALTGANDRGDLTGIRTAGGKYRVVAECKDYGGEVNVGTWLREMRVEADNDKAEVGFVIAKRRGISDPARQIVMMEARDLAILLGADPEEVDG